MTTSLESLIFFVRSSAEICRALTPPCRLLLPEERLTTSLSRHTKMWCTQSFSVSLTLIDFLLLGKICVGHTSSWEECFSPYVSLLR
eukprot:COSAG02_NODE_7340_length_3056_cov_5.073047_5_plen_86_part_01